MKFTGRVTFEWQLAENDVFRLRFFGVHLGSVYFDEGRWWAVCFHPLGSVTPHDSLDGAKAALLAALGIVVEWETPQGEAKP